MKTIFSKQISAFALALMLGASAVMAADKGQRGQLSAKDFKFATRAAHGGMSEVQLGEIGKQKAANAQVKALGQKMISDHKKANDELNSIISKKGAVLPANIPHKETSTAESLQKASGADFDREYVDHMVKDHKKDVKEFEDAAKTLSDPDLRAFAQKTLPTLQEHLRMAEQIQATIKR